MRTWFERLLHDASTRTRLLALASALALGGLVYWRTDDVLESVLLALAASVIVLALAMCVRRRRARLAQLEETVAQLRSEVERLRQGGPAPTLRGAASPASTAGVARTGGERRPFDPAGWLLSAESSWRRLWVWLVGDNAAVRVGVIVLFVGAAFLLRYAYDQAGALSFGKRLAGVLLGAAVLLGVGWCLRLKRPAFAQALQGGGVGLLYVAVAGAGDAVPFLQGAAGFVLLAGVVALAGFLAIRQNAQWIAILGIAGGFLAPVLASEMRANGVTLFSYYLLLNVGILAIALHKSWRALNALGLVLTFCVAAVWGARFYGPQQIGAIEPFVILYFLLYVAVAVVDATRRTPQLDDYVDGIIVFGTPLLAFTLQLGVVRGLEHGAAWSAFAVAALYMVLAIVLSGREPAGQRALAKAFFLLALIFATVTLPLALDGRSTAGLWALEGAAIYWASSRRDELLLGRTAGLLLQLAAGVVLLAVMYRGVSETPVWNGFFLSCVLIAWAGLISSRIAEHRAASGPWARILFAWGLAWWLMGGLHEIAGHVRREDVQSAALLFLTATCALASFCWGRGWSLARFPALALAPLMAVILVVQTGERPGSHLLAGLGVLAWPVAFLFHFRILRRHEDVYPRDLSCAHILGFWVLVAGCMWEAGWLVSRAGSGQYSGMGVAWVAVIIFALLAVSLVRGFWPVARYREAYLWRGAKLLIALLALWMLYVNIPVMGQSDLGSYVPLLNPLDVTHVIAFGVLVVWWHAVQASDVDARHEFPSTWPVTAWCVAIFLWANAVLFRTLHYYAGMPYQLQAMLDSNLVQMSISVVWAALAVATMFTAVWWRKRQMWIVGSALMAVVILKLLVIEVPRASAVESMIAIVVVGLLLLVTGYVAPVPPPEAEAT